VPAPQALPAVPLDPDDATEVAFAPAGVQVPAPQVWPAVPLDPERCDAQLAPRRAERINHERVVEALLAEQGVGATVAIRRARAKRLWQLRETVMRISYLFRETPLDYWDAHWGVEVAKFDDGPTEAWPVRTCIKEKRTQRAWTIPWEIPEGRGANQERETGTLSSKDHKHIKWLVSNCRDLNGPGGIAMSPLEETVFDRIKRALNAMERNMQLKTAKCKRKRAGDNAEGGEAQGSASGNTPAA